MDARMNPGTSEPIHEINDLTQQLKLMQATELAAEGHYEQALAVLDTIPPDTRYIGPGADLRARIAAQQGDLKKAEAYWSDAVEADPKNQLYSSALKYVRADLAGAAPLRINPSTLTKASLLIAAVAVLYMAFHGQRQIQVSQAGLLARIASLEMTISEQAAAQSAASTLAVSDLAGRVDALDTNFTHAMVGLNEELTNQGSALDALTSSQSGLITQLTEKPPEPLDITLPGIRTEVVNNWIEISFEEGLFSNAATMNSGSRDLILNLGNELNSFTDEYQLVVVGYTDDIECGACTGSTLNLARAELVVELLAEATNLSLDDFAIKLPGDRPAPYPNTSTENRLRNRTVILLLSPIMQ